MSSDHPHSEDGAESTKTASSLDEFGAISRFFNFSKDAKSSWPSQGIGDDCAFLDIGSSRIAVSADMMAMGTHFLPDADPFKVGQKALAVNLSDLAAAGAAPEAFFLSLSLPKIDIPWLEGFSRGLRKAAEDFGCPLRGGDTTKSPAGSGVTSFSITILGSLPFGKGLMRKGARPGDDIWVSGTPGDAYAALGTVFGEIWAPKESLPYFMQRLELPTPRIALGKELLNLASACADISDGLAGDLKHILERSSVSAELWWNAFPRSTEMLALSDKEQQRCILGGGDDYELIFTAPQENRKAIENLSGEAGCLVTRIGRIVSKSEDFRIIDERGNLLPLLPSFNHFS